MTNQLRKPRGALWPDLHQDLVRVVYEIGEREGILELKDRLRALAVCRAWKGALTNLPLGSLFIRGGEEDKELCNWVIQRQPTVTRLELWSASAKAMTTLAALQRKGLTSLVWATRGHFYITDALPCPLAYLFPSLCKLDLVGLMVASTWLCELSSLQVLRELRLRFWELTDAATAGAAVRFPSLPSLAHLNVTVWQGPPELHIELDDLPALTELELNGGRAALQASRPVPKLQRLSNYAEKLAVDFGALPCLKSATFYTSRQLDAPASIAAATALTYLELNIAEDEWDPSALELLRSLAPSVRCVSMGEHWPQEAADLLGNMTNLVGLELRYATFTPLLADDAPVWAGLRAFGSCSLMTNDERAAVPKGLRQASKLEVLQVMWSNPTIEDMDVLTSIPALRKLFVYGYSWRASDPVGSAVLNLSRRALPQVEVVLDAADFGEEFFQLWCAQLGPNP